MIDSHYFVPGAEQVHPDWIKDWGKNIGSAELAYTMFNSNRLRNRLYEHVMHSSEIQMDARFSDLELSCLNSYVQDKKRLERICGLVIYGKVIREHVTKAEFDQIAKQIPVEEMKIAVSLRDLHFEDLAYSVDMSRLGELVQRTGASCVSLWRHYLHPQMKLRVDFMEEPGNIGEIEEALVNNDEAAAIVAAVSHAISQEMPRLAA